ncbi:MAG: hypothetical protein ASARMPRED_003538 [Alectoria sarmentosa]|nr:MAG: hypothetical protein ASARMPRED_003538 [Alectoria sarmentosa]
MPTTTPSSSVRAHLTSSIDLITKILNAAVEKDSKNPSRYLHLWRTVHPSLGDRYMVSGGDVGALSLALDSIYKEQGFLFPSVEFRDIAGRVWIGFRGDANPKSRRYATIQTYAFKGRFTSTGWEAGLEKLKEGTAAAVDKVKIAADKKVSGPIDRAPCSGITVSKMKMSTLQAAEATTAIDQQALVPVSTQVLASMPHDPSHGENDTVPAIDAGSGEIADVAESGIRADPGGAEYQVGGAWNWVDTGEEDEEWTKV